MSPIMMAVHFLSVFIREAISLHELPCSEGLWGVAQGPLSNYDQ